MLIQGLNVYGGIISSGLNDSSDDLLVIVDTAVTIQIGDWFVRENKNTPLIGPMNYRDANAQARFLSLAENGSGLAELITFLGSRGGDPLVDPPKLFVEAMYARGKKFLGGRVAQFHSDNELITYVPDYGYKLFTGFRNR